MSANRIVRRRAYKASQPSVYAYLAAERAAGRGEAGVPAKRTTWHDYAVAAGYRHPTYQAGIRLARAEHGLQPTSSDMSRVHGQRVA